MKAPLRKFLIREAGGVREAETLVVGTGMLVGETAGGLPELLGVAGGEIVLQPSGGDDTQAIRDALATGQDVRLGPGQFTISATLTIPGGAVLSGSGATRTELRATHAGIAVALGAGSSDALLTRLALVGPGRSVAGSAGIHAVGPGSGLSFRNLHIRGFAGNGLHVQSFQGVECSSLSIEHVGGSGIALETDATERIVVSNVSVRSTLYGISISQARQVTLDGMTVTNAVSGYGVYASGASNLRLSAVRVSNNIDVGIVLDSCSSVSLDGCEVRGADLSMHLGNTWDVAINGFRSLAYGYGGGLSISGGGNVVINGMLSDRSSGLTLDEPHLIVSNGATGVLVAGFRKINNPLTSANEAHIATAGGRVVFIQHNLDPARINSGGNFVQL